MRRNPHDGRMEHLSQDRAALEVARRLWHWGGGIFILAISAVARKLIVTFGGADVVGGIIAAIGEGLLTAGVCLFLAWIGYVVWKATPAQRFHDMSQEIDVAMAGLTESLSSETGRFLRRPSTDAAIRTIAHRLDRLGIPRPPFSVMGFHKWDWLAFLPPLLGAARATELAKARLLWKEIQAANVETAPGNITNLRKEQADDQSQHER